MKHRKIGFVVAEQAECEPLCRLTQARQEERFGRCVYRFERSGIDCLAMLCGVGKSNAAAAAAYLIAEGADLLISIGYSGGISGVRRGETALATRFVEHDFDLTPLGYAPAQRPEEPWIYPADEEANALLLSVFGQLRAGTMVTGDCFVCDDGKRQELSDRFGAVSCDMETAAVAGVGYRAGVGTVAIRCISDDAGNNANALYREVSAGYEESAAEMALILIDKLSEA